MKTVVHKALCNTKLTIVLKEFHCIFSTLCQKVDPLYINQQLN